MSKPPPPGTQLKTRGVAVKVVPVTCKVPLLKVIAPAGLPRLLSAETDTVPRVRVVPPV